MPHQRPETFVTTIAITFAIDIAIIAIAIAIAITFEIAIAIILPLPLLPHLWFRISSLHHADSLKQEGHQKPATKENTILNKT